MSEFLNFQVIADNFTYFMIGRYPNGPLGGLGLTLYLAVVSCLLSVFGGIDGQSDVFKNELCHFEI